MSSLPILGQTPDADPARVRIGISACLLGEEVRYNGGHKRDSFLTDTFGQFVQWISVCPEVEIGMGTPRAPIRLERTEEGGIRLVMPSTGEDYTEAMRSYAERRVAELAGLELDGYVLKKDSPSCGMERVKIYHGASATKDGRGMFADVLLAHLPDLPVEEEGRLNDPLLRENFVTRVFVHNRWREGERAGWTRASLMRFHERHKFLLMARNQAGMRRLGRLLGESAKNDPADDLARAYRQGLTEVLRRPATRRGHTNVLLHLHGYVSDLVNREDRAELVETIGRYRTGLVPLIVPLTLLRHHVRRLGIEYLRDPVYLEPHPHELMLLNHVRRHRYNAAVQEGDPSMETQTSSSRAAGPVLAATDFSATAAAALDWATELARQLGSRLELVHAVTTPPLMPGYVPASGLDFTADVRRAAEKRLQELAASLRQAGTEAEAYLDVGTPFQVILDRAEAVAASVIVLGTRGLTGLRHLLLGSTTERVIHGAPCPVLAIHPEDRGQHRPLRTILVPTDFSEDAELAITTAHRLLAPLDRDARLVLVNAFNLPIEYTTYGLLPTSIKYMEDAGLEAERRLYELSQRFEREGLTVETVAREGDPAHVITEEAEKRGADLIAMGTRGHSALRHLLIGSTAERVIQHAPCPVMTIKRPKE